MVFAGCEAVFSQVGSGCLGDTLVSVSSGVTPRVYLDASSVGVLGGCAGGGKGAGSPPSRSLSAQSLEGPAGGLCDGAELGCTQFCSSSEERSLSGFPIVLPRVSVEEGGETWRTWPRLRALPRWRGWKGVTHPALPDQWPRGFWDRVVAPCHHPVLWGLPDREEASAPRPRSPRGLAKGSSLGPPQPGCGCCPAASPAPDWPQQGLWDS